METWEVVKYATIGTIGVLTNIIIWSVVFINIYQILTEKETSERKIGAVA